MNGFDIARWQGNISNKVPGDFVIVKATQSTDYVSPVFESQYSSMKAAGKLLGIYHYAGGGRGAVAEANHFINTIKSKLGEAILVLDWEGDMNPVFSNSEYAKTFIRHVINTTGIIPFIYMSKSTCRSQNWDDIAGVVPLWVAQYPKNNKTVKTGYKTNPWTDNNSFGPWKSPKIFQYSSNGKLDNYSGALDLDLAYMDKAEWLTWAKKQNVSADLSVKEKFPKKIQLISGSLNIREKSTVSSTDIGDLVTKDLLTVYKEENKFYWFEGWISSNSAYSIKVNTNQVKVKTSTLTIREKSSKTSNALGYLHTNSVVKYDKTENGFYHISGWFSGKTAYTKEV